MSKQRPTKQRTTINMTCILHQESFVLAARKVFPASIRSFLDTWLTDGT